MNQPVKARWYALDMLSAPRKQKLPQSKGNPVPTSEANQRLFYVRALDRAGNETYLQVNCQVLYALIPLGAEGTYLDNPLLPADCQRSGNPEENYPLRLLSRGRTNLDRFRPQRLLRRNLCRCHPYPFHSGGEDYSRSGEAHRPELGRDPLQY